jgi:hypothetical protein
MTSKIKVDNIENQCGSAVVTKCGGTTTINGTTVVASAAVKTNAYQASDGGNIIDQSGSTITLGASGDTIQLAGGASQTGFGRTGTVDWDTTPKTATFTAVSGDGFFANTTGGSFTMNLPAGSAGAIVSVADYAGTWQTNALTVSPNGTDKIGAISANVSLSTEGQSVTFIFVDSTQGWINTMDSTSNVRAEGFISATGGTITNSGNCRIHTFTGPGTFCVSSLACAPANNRVSYMVVAGGGGGGTCGGGGGGAGGFRESQSPTTPYTTSPLVCAGAISVTVTAFPITVGGGGAGGAKPQNIGTTGSNSVFSTITSAGGGAGGKFTGNPSITPGCKGQPGGSGGGSGGIGPTGVNPGGSGNTPSTSPSQGNNGGPGQHIGGCTMSSGGGGGATAAGAIGTQQSPGPGSSTGGPGGNGATTSISGSSTVYAGGGGGAGFENASGCGPGGTGGGGTGGGRAAAASSGGTANTGGGGGGGAHPGGGVNGGSAGGSGVVIIRYKFQ